MTNRCTTPLTSTFLFALTVTPGCFCGTPDLTTFTHAGVYVETGNGRADVFAGLWHEDGGCAGDAGTVQATINGSVAEAQLRNTGGAAGGPTIIATGCALDFSASFTFDDDGVTEDVAFSVVTDDANVDGVVPAILPHAFIDLTLDGGGDVLVPGSRHTFEVTPPLVGEHEVAFRVERDGFVPPTTGTQLSADAIEIVVDDEELPGRGQLIVDIERSVSCEIDGFVCEADLNVRAERDVTVQ